MVAGLMIGQKDLAPIGDPLYRPVQPPSHPGDQRIFGIAEILGPKPTPDIRRDKPDGLSFDT
jgi:hypothetical protein